MSKKLLRIIVFSLVLVFLLYNGIPAIAAGRTRKQDTVHEIAELARSIGLPENDPIILRAQEIWWEEEHKNQLKEKYGITQAEINAIARTIWGEAGGIPNKAEQAAVAWCILNRYDNDYGKSILNVITAKNQFDGYSPSFPLKENLVELAEDVVLRWCREKEGEINVGRTLPADYFFFHGDGRHNWFRKEYRSNTYWDWSLPNPYE